MVNNKSLTSIHLSPVQRLSGPHCAISSNAALNLDTNTILETVGVVTACTRSCAVREIAATVMMARWRKNRSSHVVSV